MCRVLIIGAGGVGTVVAHKVAKNKVFTDIMLASRTKSIALYNEIHSRNICELDI